MKEWEKHKGVSVPDVDGRVGQDLAVAVPAAVGGGTATSRVVLADVAEDLAFAVLLQVQLQVRVALAVARREAETPHSVDLDKCQVKLWVRVETVREVWRCCDLHQFRVFHGENREKKDHKLDYWL